MALCGLEALHTELAAWQKETNADQCQVEWHLSTGDARFKLRRLYLTTKQNSAAADY